MTHIVRLMTALVVGSLVWSAVNPPSLLRVTIYGSWALGVAYMGWVWANLVKDPE